MRRRGQVEEVAKERRRQWRRGEGRTGRRGGDEGIREERSG